MTGITNIRGINMATAFTGGNGAIMAFHANTGAHDLAMIHLGDVGKRSSVMTGLTNV